MRHNGRHDEGTDKARAHGKDIGMTLSTIPADAIVTKGEAARLLAMSRSTLDRRIGAGKIVTLRDGRILGATLVAYVGPELRNVRAGIVGTQRQAKTESIRLRAVATTK